MGIKDIDSAEYAKTVFSAFNSFGNMTAKANSFIEADKKLSLGCFALTALFLAFQYEKETYDPWDDRDKMSKKYSYDNKDTFLKKFEEISGIRVSFDTGKHFTDWENSKQFRDSGYEGWIKKLVTEHPTIRQSYMRGFVGALRDEWNLPDGTFPMI